MRMMLRLLVRVLLAVSVLYLAGCSSVNTAGQTGAGFLFVAAQGDTDITAYTVAQSSGAIGTNGSSIPTGNFPSAIAVTPSGTSLFVSNRSSNSISSYTVSSNGALTAASATTPTGKSPVGLAVDPLGRFLFVANQADGTISVFSINGSALTAVGKPVSTIPPGTPAGTYPNGTTPVAVIVSGSGNFLYVANQSANFVSKFAIASTGALSVSGVPFYLTGISPTGLAVTPSGAFLYVANSGSNDVSAFSICDKVVTTCGNVNAPDGTLTPVAGSPFPAGQGPVAIAVDPAFNFLYVVDQQSSQVSGYLFGAGSGVLTPLATPALSTGTSPNSIAILPGVVTSQLGNLTFETTDYVYVANTGSSTISIFSINTTTGLLDNVSGSPFISEVNPTAVAVILP
jgi:6-phosphogluconolactonase